MLTVDQDSGLHPAYISKLAYPSYHYYSEIDKVLVKREITVGTVDHHVHYEIDKLMNTDSYWVILSHLVDLPTEVKLIKETHAVTKVVTGAGTQCLLITD